jgi:hypothetical protein
MVVRRLLKNFHRSKTTQGREGKGIQITNKEGKLQVWIGWTFKKGVYGRSMILQNDGTALFGYFNEHSQMVGQGIKLYPNGDRYEGEFVNGQRHGPGTYFFKNGDVYDGNWFAGAEGGKGVIH